jgi:hypothetical protein
LGTRPGFTEAVAVVTTDDHERLVKLASRPERLERVFEDRVGLPDTAVVQRFERAELPVRTIAAVERPLLADREVGLKCPYTVVAPAVVRLTGSKVR